ncbi:hypothetical protein M422DRAFT_48207 [Sphaerobolus stellatus SS14]|uniref:Uncharacterized protein n=1 Tax=Sphaerobolus stellatus (strain SS14) TaxID=990650 RepID=A0A0C9V5X7_SPHS4|nr:hypothetical protein M422DRAFT_48207 [Sphaerobolus stellatus SS14]
MHRLTRFRLVSMTRTAADNVMLDQIFSAVAKAPFRLQRLALRHRHRDLTWPQSAPKAPETPYFTPQLNSITALSLIHCVHPSCFPSPFHVALFSAPKLPLRDLDLNIVWGRLAGIGDGELEMRDVLASVHWPQLQRLELTFDRNSFESESQMKSLRIFFIRHTNLEVVSLCGIPFPDLPADALPRLRSLNLEFGQGTVYQIPHHIARNIHHFMVIIRGDEMLHVLKDMEELRSCQVMDIRNLAKLHDFSPHLEQLSYSQPGYWSDWGTGTDVNCGEVQREVELLKERISQLAMFTQLTHLGQFLACFELEINTPMSGNSGLLRELVNSIHTLKYVQICRHGSIVWVRVERDEEGQYVGFHPLSSSEQIKQGIHSWGNFYRGFSI